MFCLCTVFGKPWASRKWYRCLQQIYITQPLAEPANAIVISIIREHCKIAGNNWGKYKRVVDMCGVVWHRFKKVF